MLMQRGRPLAFFSQALKGRILDLSTCEDELLAWCMLLKSRETIPVGWNIWYKNDQQSLKFMLQQEVGTPSQQKWVSKLLGNDFTIVYKKGKENIVVDALSRKIEREEEDEFVPPAITILDFFWIKKLKKFLFA